VRRHQSRQVYPHIPALHKVHRQHDPGQELDREGSDEKGDTLLRRLESGPVIRQRKDKRGDEGRSSEEVGVQSNDYGCDEDEEDTYVGEAGKELELDVGSVFIQKEWIQYYT